MENGREQFTFFASFAVALRRIKKASDRCAAYDAIVNYALYETIPDLEKLPDAAAIAFDLIRPNLDSSRKKAKSGKIGGSVKQSDGKEEANAKQSTREKENEIEKEKEGEIEKEKEDECLSNPSIKSPCGGPAAGDRSAGIPPANPQRPQPGDPLYMDKTIQAVKRWKAAGKEGWINDYF